MVRVTVLLEARLSGQLARELAGLCESFPAFVLVVDRKGRAVPVTGKSLAGAVRAFDRALEFEVVGLDEEHGAQALRTFFVRHGLTRPDQVEKALDRMCRTPGPSGEEVERGWQQFLARQRAGLAQTRPRLWTRMRLAWQSAWAGLETSPGDWFRLAYCGLVLVLLARDGDWPRRTARPLGRFAWQLRTQAVRSAVMVLAGADRPSRPAAPVPVRSQDKRRDRLQRLGAFYCSVLPGLVDQEAALFEAVKESLAQGLDPDPKELLWLRTLESLKRHVLCPVRAAEHR